MNPDGYGGFIWGQGALTARMTVTGRRGERQARVDSNPGPTALSLKQAGLHIGPGAEVSSTKGRRVRSGPGWSLRGYGLSGDRALEEQARL